VSDPEVDVMHHRSRISSCFVLCLLLLGVPGCSFWAVRGANPSVTGGGDCSTSPAAPIVDGVLAGTFVGFGVAGVNTAGCSGACWLDMSGAAHGAGAGLIAVGVIEAAAATYGAVKISQCRQAKKELLAPPVSRPVPAPSLHLGTPPDGALSRVGSGAIRRSGDD
jgi:hypothetical protein